MNQIQNEIKSMIRDFHKNNDGINREDYSYKEAVKKELEDLSPLTTHDLGFINGLQYALSLIENK